MSCSLEMKNNRKAREIAEKYLEKVDMLNGVMHYPRQPEEQRVAIARAFACEAKVLFCDEPTGNLDSTNSKMIQIYFLMFLTNQALHLSL